jgi:diguanylate cyclase (GGDEF)-like protein/PAS domain S-box-containing protein
MPSGLLAAVLPRETHWTDRSGRDDIPFITHLKHSLKARVTLLTLVISMTGIWSLTLFATQRLQADMARMLGEQQLSTVSAVAAQVNGAIEDRLRGLEDYAKGRFSQEVIANAALAQERLEAALILRSMFNGGIFLTDAQGTAIASLPVSAPRVGLNYMDRDSVAEALKAARSVVGRPSIGKVLQTPIIHMVAPVIDARGTVIGALVGATDLGKANFLDKVTSNRYGRTGSYLLVSRKHRLVVTASEKGRAMEALPAPGLSPTVDRFLQGHEGVAVFTNPVGVEVLVAVKGVPAADWYAVAALPTAEAFGPVHKLRDTMLLAALLITLLSCGMTWWMLRRQLQPMEVAARALVALSDKDRPLTPLPVRRQDEIGQLVGGFNRLLVELDQRQQALMESEERWKFALEGSGDGVWDWNIQTGEARYSKRWKEMLGFAEGEVQNKASEWSDRVHPEDTSRVMAAIQAHIDGKTPSAEVEFRMLCKDGRWIWILGRGIVARRTSDGRPLRLVGTNTDITARKQLEDQIRQQALLDALTGLPNRRMLGDRLDQAMASSKRTGHCGALMAIDLDNFKTLNDAHGHAAGDLLLVEVGQRLRSCVREMDTVARTGGDEFVVVIGELGKERADAVRQAGFVAEKVRASLSAPYVLTPGEEGRAEPRIEHRCTASIGVALFVDHAATPDDVLRSADSAMYEAKGAGRNAIRLQWATDGPHGASAISQNEAWRRV